MEERFKIRRSIVTREQNEESVSEGRNESSVGENAGVKMSGSNEESLKEKVRDYACKCIKEKERATLKEIKDCVRKKLGRDYDWIEEAIKQTCVNYCSRAGNTTTEILKKHSCLFAVNNKRITDDSKFEFYDPDNPDKHGKWDLDESTQKPYLKEIPDITNYLEWLKELYGEEWNREESSVKELLDEFRELIEEFRKKGFDKTSYRNQIGKFRYFSSQLPTDVENLFKQQEVDDIITIVKETDESNYKEKIDEFVKKIEELQEKGYERPNQFITSLAHILNSEFYIPVSGEIATLVIVLWWEEISKKHGYEQRKGTTSRNQWCVGYNSKNTECLRKFLIELNEHRIEAGIGSMAEVAFLLNRRKKDEKECIEKNVGTENPEGDSSGEALGEKKTMPLNTIFYGPPGTGKTFSVIKRSVEIVKGDNFNCVEEAKKEFKKLLFTSENDENWRIAFVTFHPSTSYETFIEGIWAEADGNGSVRYRVKDGIFKIVAYHALWLALKKEERTGCNSYEERKKKVLESLKKHFDGESPFDFENADNVVLIIDEINRGNIPSIFGELITLIEDTKRLGSRSGEDMPVILPYSGEIFAIPRNLYIIGTMNTADRSIVLLDAALRRRFSFEEFLPEADKLKGMSIGDLNVGKFLEKLNDEIKKKKGKDFTIGHAYFMPLKGVSDENERKSEFVNILVNKVLPLLQEYFYDDWETLVEILGGGEVREYIIDSFGEIKHGRLMSEKDKVIEILSKFVKGNSERGEQGSEQPDN